MMVFFPIALGVLATLAGLIFVGVGIRRVTAGEAVAAPRPSPRDGEASQAPWVVPCTKCERKLRVPRGRGTLQVICPRCKTRFALNSDTGKPVSS